MRKRNTKYEESDDAETAAPRVTKKFKIELFCTCQKPHEQGVFMVGCDECDGWFNPKRVSLSEAAFPVVLVKRAFFLVIHLDLSSLYL